MVSGRAKYGNKSSESLVPISGNLGEHQDFKNGRSKRTKLICESISATRESPTNLTLGLLIGVGLAVFVVAGTVVGVLAAKKIIRTSSKANTTAEPGSAVTSTASTSSASFTEANNGAIPTPQPTSSTVASSTGSVLPGPTACSTSESIPSSAKNTFMDPTSWLDMTGFNCTFTSATVGGLPIVGLNLTWDDSTQANPTVPALNKAWAYGSQPIRGVNLGGWLSLEPFITPSLFQYPSNLQIFDEYSLCAHLGKDATTVLEKHYATFITENDFKAIAVAGLDHVRIQFSYWAAETYDNDPYPSGLSWRYLLRGIEWARKYGLRVNLDLHGLPGSQNGWNHSGRQGAINWILGTDGAKNAQRSLDLHDQLSKFFAQDRYKNVVAFYGLANEPSSKIPMNQLIDWTTQAYSIVKKNGVGAIQVFSESMKGLPSWSGQLGGYGNSLVIDVHEYTIFDPNLLKLKHADRIAFACNTWSGAIASSEDKSAGFGPTMVGEWSLADTDCAQYLNGIGNGARWMGTFNGGGPSCPTQDSQCSCEQSNADPSTYTSEYRSFLKIWGEAQMFAFEKGWGWFYWAWKAESAPLWSYQAGLAGGMLPSLAYQREWSCTDTIPGFGGLPEYY